METQVIKDNIQKITETLTSLQYLLSGIQLEAPTGQHQALASLPFSSGKEDEKVKFHFKTPMKVNNIKKLMQNLVLNLKSIVLNIFPYRGQLMNWSTKRKIAHHLVTLLQLN